MKTLETIEAGDEVVYQNNVAWDSCTKLVKVDKTTKTQVIIGDDRFNRSGGYLRGSTGYHRTLIFVPTEKDRERILLAMKRRKAVDRLSRMIKGSEHLSEATLDKILRLHKDHLAESSTPEHAV